MKAISLVSAVLLAAAMLFSCASTEPIEDNLTPGEFFQKAQVASSEYQDYTRALEYYQEFTRRFPDQPLLIIEAEYEIAFLYYKMKDYSTSAELFGAILDKYSKPEAAVLPAWPKVLSEKLLEMISEEQRKLEEKAEASGS